MGEFGEMARLYSQKKSLTHMIEVLEDANGWRREVSEQLRINVAQSKKEKFMRLMKNLEVEDNTFFQQLKKQLNIGDTVDFGEENVRKMIASMIQERGMIA